MPKKVSDAKFQASSDEKKAEILDEEYREKVKANTNNVVRTTMAQKDLIDKIWLYYVINSKNQLVQSTENLTYDDKREAGLPADMVVTDVEMDQSDVVTENVIDSFFPTVEFKEFQEFYFTLGVTRGKILHDMAKRRKSIYDELTEENQELKAEIADNLIRTVPGKENLMIEAQNALLREVKGKNIVLNDGNHADYDFVLDGFLINQCYNIFLTAPRNKKVEDFLNDLELSEEKQNGFLSKYKCKKTDNLFEVMQKSQLALVENNQTYLKKNEEERKKYLFECVRKNLGKEYSDHKKEQWINQGVSHYKNTRPVEERAEVDEGIRIGNIIASKKGQKALPQEVENTVKEKRIQKKREFYKKDFKELEKDLHSGKSFGMRKALYEPEDNLDIAIDIDLFNATYRKQKTIEDKYWMGLSYALKENFLIMGKTVSDNPIERMQLGYHYDGYSTHYEESGERAFANRIKEIMSNNLTFESAKDYFMMFGRTYAKIKAFQGKQYDQIYQGLAGEDKQIGKAKYLYVKSEMFMPFTVVKEYQSEVLNLIGEQMAVIMGNKLNVSEKTTFREVFRKLGLSEDQMDSNIENIRGKYPTAELDNKVLDVVRQAHVENDEGYSLREDMMALNRMVAIMVTGEWLKKGEEEAVQRLNSKDKYYYDKGDDLFKQQETGYDEINGFDDWINEKGKSLAKNLQKAYCSNELGRMKAALVSKRSMGLARDEKAVDGLYQGFMEEKSTYLTDSRKKVIVSLKQLLRDLPGKKQLICILAKIRTMIPMRKSIEQTNVLVIRRRCLKICPRLWQLRFQGIENYHLM